MYLLRDQFSLIVAQFITLVRLNYASQLSTQQHSNISNWNQSLSWNAIKTPRANHLISLTFNINTLTIIRINKNPTSPSLTTPALFSQDKNRQSKSGIYISFPAFLPEDLDFLQRISILGRYYILSYSYDLSCLAQRCLRGLQRNIFIFIPFSIYFFYYIFFIVYTALASYHRWCVLFALGFKKNVEW